MSSNVALDDNGFLFEESKVLPAEETPYVSLDGDGSPCLCAAPFFFQLLVQLLLKEHLNVVAYTVNENLLYLSN